MNINEIKIGDWFEFKEGQGQISLIYGDEVIIGTLQLKIAELGPIPLTKKILEKNGWELTEWGEYVKYYEGFDNIGITSSEYCHSCAILWYVSVDGTYITTIHYIHELQHLLWTIGLDDNLKV